MLIDLKVRPEVPPLAGFTHVRMTKFSAMLRMTLVDTEIELKYKRRRCQNGKDSKSDLHERASRRSSEAHNRRCEKIGALWAGMKAILKI